MERNSNDVKLAFYEILIAFNSGKKTRFVKKLEPYSQQFVFFITYEWAQ